jgi:tripartite ATP-independent transporter DctP family solute receptor
VRHASFVEYLTGVPDAVQRARSAGFASPNARRGALLIRDRQRLEFVRSRVCSAPLRAEEALRAALRPGHSSRRRFISAGAAAILAGAGTQARAEFRYRLGMSQPLDSPNYLRMREMSENVRAESNGRMLIEVYGAGKLGSDNTMLAQLQNKQLEMYLGGNVFGPLVPVTEIAGLPFTFKNSTDVFAALDGELGDYIRAEMLAKGIHAFRRGLDNGFHQLTTRSKPIRSAEDLVGMTIRTPVQTMTVEFFEALGAKPMKFTLTELYDVLKNLTVDGQTDPLGLIVLMRLYEVQTYLSLTNHWWSGFTVVANAAAWQALPADLQAIVEKHVDAAALAQRDDIAKLNAGALDTLRGKGMIVVETDTSGFKKPLAAFYARWKENYGPKAWGLLEGRVGKLL